MCGIGAVATLDGRALGPEADGLVQRLADALAHRGPDDRELLREGPVGMAFTRLSLVDPDSGAQPLTTDDGSLVLVANGEVYNHRELAASLAPGTTLRTGSDCEVLLHLYRERGVHFLDDVRGMFAIILWDKRENRLVLARDRFGIKPVYFHRDADRIVLASEMKALLADPATPRGLDWEGALTSPLLSAAPFLQEGSPSTFLTGVSLVPAATVRRIDLADGRTEDHRYWTFPDRPAASGSAEDIVARYRELFDASVRECATADAELGLFLSGGIDSAAVAACAAGLSPDLHTFTVLSASTYRSEDAEYGHRVADKLGLPNHQVVFDDTHVPTPEEWKRVLWLSESPFCGPEIYYKYQLHRYAKAARPELRGMLLGAASDEFNGGYSVDLSGGESWADFDRTLRTLARDRALRARPELAPWWAPGTDALLTDETAELFAGPHLDDPYGDYLRWQYAKLQQYNVWHEDRTAAGSGIEARVPFLDHRLVEVSATVPRALRAELLWDKQILRRGMRGVLPDDVIDRPKQPFFYGVGQQYTYRMLQRMLCQRGDALVEEATSTPGARRFVDADALRDTLRRAADDPSGSQVEMALRVVNLGLLDAMLADVPPPVSTLPAGPLPVRLDVADWDGRREEIEERTGLLPPMTAASVPSLAEGVLVLTAPGDDPTGYVAVEGSIEFVLDDDARTHRDLLNGVDGATPLGELVAGLGLTLEEARPVLAELVENRVVTLDGPSAD